MKKKRSKMKNDRNNEMLRVEKKMLKLKKKKKRNKDLEMKMPLIIKKFSVASDIFNNSFFQ